MSKMLIDRAVAEQALETLELLAQPTKTNNETPRYKAHKAAITALRAALAQEGQEPEPVAIYCKAKRDNGGFCPHHNLHCGWPDCNKPLRMKQKQEPVAMLWKIRKALALASAICDRVPTRWHYTHEIGSAEADIGDMVNAHPDGAHGYRLIKEAEAELVAYLTTSEAVPPRIEQLGLVNIARQLAALADGLEAGNSSAEEAAARLARVAKGVVG